MHWTTVSSRLATVLCILVWTEGAYCSDPKASVGQNYRLYLPEVAGRLPGVIVVPGCSGVSYSRGADAGGGSPTDPLFRRHYPKVADRLAKHGYVVLVLDYLTPENQINACRGEIPLGRIAQYIEDAAKFLEGHPRVDPKRVHIVGWSLGGAAALKTLERDNRHIKSVTAVYPNCRDSSRSQSKTPVLVLLGELDDIASPDVCMGVISELSNVRVRNFSNARHGFDVIEARGIVSTGRGTTVGYNRQAARVAWRTMLEFLRTAA